MSKPRWDIFCKVVDNFGDIGVCWRLAKQLACEHGLPVNLMIDDLALAQKIIPALHLSKKNQIIQGVKISHWQTETVFTTAADVVIEAFACELPTRYLALMQQKTVWVNVEYLSAEPWVADFHGRHSTVGNLTRHFYFPGFSENTGGLIREKNAVKVTKLTQNLPCTSFPRKRESMLNLNQNLKWIPAFAGMTVEKEALNISLFCYEHAPLQALFNAVAGGIQKAAMYAPLTTSIQQIAPFFGKKTFKAGDVFTKNQLTLHVLPFLSQHDYDQLLCACDLNFVRGEDSWVRAIWAGNPFIWQPYVQTENTHLIKLAAFQALFYAEFGVLEIARIESMHKSWTNGTLNEAVWQDYLSALPEIKKSTQAKCLQLAQQPDLASKLVAFCHNAQT